MSSTCLLYNINELWQSDYRAHISHPNHQNLTSVNILHMKQVLITHMLKAALFHIHTHTHIYYIYIRATLMKHTKGVGGDDSLHDTALCTPLHHPPPPARPRHDGRSRSGGGGGGGGREGVRVTHVVRTRGLASSAALSPAPRRTECGPSVACAAQGTVVCTQRQTHTQRFIHC